MYQNLDVCLLASRVCCYLAETLGHACTAELTTILGSELRSGSSVQEEFRLADVQAHCCSLMAQSPGVQSSLGGHSCGLAHAMNPQNHVRQISIYFSPCPNPQVAFCMIRGKADIAKEPPFPAFLVLKGQCVVFIWESENNFFFKSECLPDSKKQGQRWNSDLIKDQHHQLL